MAQRPASGYTSTATSLCADSSVELKMRVEGGGEVKSEFGKVQYTLKLK